MPLYHKKVRSAPCGSGLFLCGAAMILAACDSAPVREPAAEVVLTDTDAPTVTPAPVDQSPATAPGFDSIAAEPATPNATPTAIAPTGEQQVQGTIVDFLCDPDTPVSSKNGAPPAPCTLIIRTAQRGDRRILCDAAPCDAWTARGGLPAGIRGLRAEAWISLADTFDAAGNPTGRVAKAERVSVAYTKDTR